MKDQESGSRDSFIRQQQPNILLRVLKRIDIFAFIPVPKDESVSTKQSLIGTALFFIIFLTYIIYDFVTFVSNNPPLVQSYRTQLDNNQYVLPRFAIAFMSGGLTNQTQKYDDLFTYSWSSLIKSQGDQKPFPIKWDSVQYDKAINNKTNFNLIPWMSDTAKKFYYYLRTPVESIKAKGLLYTSEETQYFRLKLFLCVNGSSPVGCLPPDSQTELINRGRIFLFIENQYDNSSISLQKPYANGNSYLLYNFFILQGYYKRININFQVVKAQILPDYLSRWSTEVTQRIQIESITEQISNVTYNNSNRDAAAFNMQLSPIIINNRISFTTLIDHISLWGAFWGVLFAIFALFFLSYNRRKFYKKNPTWDKFKNAKQYSSVNNSMPPQ